MPGFCHWSAVAQVPTVLAMTETSTTPAEELSERLFMEGLGSFHLATVYLGVALGLFDTLATSPGLTADELARAAGIDARYAREWAQAECSAGLVTADDGDPYTGHLSLADGARDVLVDETNPYYLGGLARATAAIGTALGPLVDAYRTGAGVPMAMYGPEIIAAQAQLNRPAFANDLAASWIAGMPDVQARLQDASVPARVADIGCGVGWAAIELAKAFPAITVDGFDSDESSIAEAQRNAAEHGVADRVNFVLLDAAADGYGNSAYDVVFFFECLHDFGRPVEALAAAREAVRPGGSVIVMDERTADTPQVGDPSEMFFATVSATWCLPQSRTVADCEAPGTVFRAATFNEFATRAGWSGHEVLPIEHPMFRFYRLT